VPKLCPHIGSPVKVVGTVKKSYTCIYQAITIRQWKY
jgi:hypothetical protein